MTSSRLSPNALKVLENRYFQKDKSGNFLEDADQLFRRVASHIAKAETKFNNSINAKEIEELFFSLMSELKFLPNSPTLMNAGVSLNQLSACFVLPVHDTLESIFTTLKNMAMVQQSGGGTGFNFSELRPNGDFISESSGNSSGPVSFMKLYNAATDNIKQGGKRRGANMGILNIDHPDIEEFISSKKTEGELANFNISIGIYDSFMEAVEKNIDWELKHPASGKVIKKLKAQYLWDRIAGNAWHSGDPGLVFLDTINKKNPTPGIGKINCTNPCGEVPLLPYEACNLGSIDVAKFITDKKEFDWEALEKTIRISVRFLDNVIEMNDYIIPEIEDMVKGNRKIGLGIMGWANALIQMEIPYRSEKALELGRILMKFISEKSHEMSEVLAKVRGPFRNWEKSIYFPHQLLRNATCTSIAPTGTISVIADTSSSIEPLFALAVLHQNVLDGQSFSETSQHFIHYLKSKSLYSEKIIAEVNKSGSIFETDLPEEAKEIFRTSLEIEPYWHIQHQIAFQEYTDNAVSKTINLPMSSSEDDIKNAYMTAWKLKAKGVTVFRYGSKQQQVLTSGTEISPCRICI